MTDHYDTRETRDPAECKAELFARLPDVLGGDPATIPSRATLALLPVLRKSELPALQKVF
jgi:hypothetical protein